MFFHLRDLLHIGGKAVFQHLFYSITFRAMFAAGTAFLISLVFGPAFIRWLKRKRVSEVTDRTHSDILNTLHKKKKFTPTMGGLLIVSSVVVSMLLWSNLNFFSLMACLLMVLLASVGFIDDYIKLKGAGGKTLSARKKMLLLLIVAGVVCSLHWWHTCTRPAKLWLERAPLQTIVDNDEADQAAAGFEQVDAGQVSIPFLKDWVLSMGVLYILFGMLVLTGSSNAVNLTDGLDGLATGTVLMVAITFGVLAYVSGHASFARYLYIPFVSGAGEMAVFCSALVGACMGFLWFNAHPAEVFMGDTGSLSLGGALGYVAIVVRHELLLVLAGGIFVVEALSVMLQVVSFKTTGKRIFRIAPLHHHFEAGGLHENKVIIRFWIMGAILAIVTIATLKLR